MRFDNLYVVAVAKDLGRGLGELVDGVYADGEIRRHHDWDALCHLGDGLSLRFGESRRSNNRGPGMLQISERPFRPSEIDQHIAARRGCRVAGDLDGAHGRADGGIAGDFEGGAQVELAICEHRVNEGAPHPAASAGEGNTYSRTHRPAAAGAGTSP